MQIQEALAHYKKLGEFFAPDYESDNKILSKFKQLYPTLENSQTNELIHILVNGTEMNDKFFVADLLYLYDKFDNSLLIPMLDNAIAYKDPSFNRIFLRPCLIAFGSRRIADIIADKFSKADIIQRIGIANLMYWFHYDNPEDVKNLHRLIIDQANSTKNIVERYYYALIFRNKMKRSWRIPKDAVGLIKAIKGNKEYENLLFDQLGWKDISDN